MMHPSAMAGGHSPTDPVGVSSAHLPACFHRPAPLRETGGLSDASERNYTRSRTASLAVLRIVAFGTGISWLMFMAVGRNTAGQYLSMLASPWSSIQSLIWLLFTLAALSVLASALIHRERVYVVTMLVTGIGFVCVLAVHLGLLITTGRSPLADLYLGDFVGLPMAMLMAVAPRMIGVPLAVVSIGAAVAVNLGTPLGFNTVLEVIHAEIVTLPFLVLLQSARQASATVDEAATRAHGDALRVARLKTLGELETRFLGYVHDRVLTYLDAVRRGVISPDDAEHRARVAAPVVPTRSVQLGLGGFLADTVAQLASVAPGLVVTVPDDVPESATVPADATAALTDALLEAVHNAAVHAPGARVDCEISLELDGGICDGVTVTVRDDGPGFDTTRLPRSRAGVRVAIIGRMKATDGCDATIDTAPGRGTVVTLSWHREGPAAATGTGDIAVPSVYDLAGVGRVFRPATAVFAMAVIIALSLNNDHPRPGLYLLSLAAVAVTAWALIRGRELTLAPGPTAVVAAGIVVFFIAASLENPPPAQLWPALWYPWVFVLLCTYLAIRDRAPVAWAVWAGCLVAVEVMVRTGVSSPMVDAAQLAQMSMVLLPASLVPGLAKLSTRGLPLALALDRSHAADLQVVATQRRFLSDSQEWITSEVSDALDPRFDDDVRRGTAHLLELKLRDSIRSPLFDTAEVNRAVWDARARGVQVKLLDDRSSAGENLTHAGGDPRLQALHTRLVDVLDACDHGSVTARIVPVGRESYATIVLADEEDSRQVQIT